jgi:hypothetical protein
MRIELHGKMSGRGDRLIITTGVEAAAIAAVGNGAHENDSVLLDVQGLTCLEAACRAARTEIETQAGADGDIVTAAKEIGAASRKDLGI